MAKILAFAGSSRNGSYNHTLVNIAAEGARAAGGDVTVINLGDFDVPLFNEDLEREQGMPADARKLYDLFKAHDGLLISSPEYNSSISPLLKNTIDWVSRKVGDDGSLAAYQGKVAGLMAASPGGLGGIRGLVHLRSILQNIGVMVVPNQIAVSKAFEAFDAKGQLKNEALQKIVYDISRSVVEIATKLA